MNTLEFIKDNFIIQINVRLKSYYSIVKKIHLTIEISDEVKEGSIGFYPNFWKGYISQVRGHKVVEYITEGYE